MESDATSSSLKRSVSFESLPTVAQGDNHVADQDIDDEDQGQVMGNV